MLKQYGVNENWKPFIPCLFSIMRLAIYVLFVSEMVELVTCPCHDGKVEKFELTYFTAVYSILKECVQS